MYDDEGEGNVTTYQILGSLEILAIKNFRNNLYHDLLWKFLNTTFSFTADRC